jgi:hypothetical protein
MRATRMSKAALARGATARGLVAGRERFRAMAGGMLARGFSGRFPAVASRRTGCVDAVFLLAALSHSSAASEVVARRERFRAAADALPVRLVRSSGRWKEALGVWSMERLP